MTLETFSTIIKGVQTQNHKTHDLYKHSIDILSFNDNYYRDVVHPLLIECFGSEGLDWIDWYIYEKLENPEIKAWDQNNNEICYDIPSLFKTINKDLNNVE